MIEKSWAVTPVHTHAHIYNIEEHLRNLNPRLAIRALAGDGRDVSPVEKVHNIHQSQSLKKFFIWFDLHHTRIEFVQKTPVFIATEL